MRKIIITLLGLFVFAAVPATNVLAKPSWGGNCAACHIAPSVDSFTVPATSYSLSIQVDSFVATDTDPQKSSLARVTGYMITESASAPPTRKVTRSPMLGFY